MKNLIINADDFGMSKEVNSGTISGIKHGVISSVSVMVNMPYFEEAVNFLKKHPKVSVGLHFNITEGKSILIPREVGSLLREDNSFFFWPFLGQQILFKNIKLIEIQSELKAQFTKLSKTGLTITHIDSHHHIHLVPRIFKVISNFANQQKQVTLRGNEFDLWNLTIGIMKKPIPTQIIVNLMLLLNNLKNKKHNLYSAQRFYDLNWGKNFSIKEFELVLKNLPEGTTEFICHLAKISDEGNLNFLKPRQKVLQLLTNTTIKKQLKDNGITLISHEFKKSKNIDGRLAFAVQN